MKESICFSRWDRYFNGICEAVSLKSSCLSRKIGAILVKDHYVIATAFNGPPRGIPHCDSYERRSYLHEVRPDLFKKEYIAEFLDVCPRKLMGFSSGEGIEYCIAAHAERNLLNQCSRLGVETMGAKVYMNSNVLPCKECFLELIQAGISKVICTKARSYNDIEWLKKYSKIRFREFHL